MLKHPKNFNGYTGIARHTLSLLVLSLKKPCIKAHDLCIKPLRKNPVLKAIIYKNTHSI